MTNTTTTAPETLSISALIERSRDLDQMVEDEIAMRTPATYNATLMRFEKDVATFATSQELEYDMAIHVLYETRFTFDDSHLKQRIEAALKAAGHPTEYLILKVLTNPTSNNQYYVLRTSKGSGDFFTDSNIFLED